MKKPRALFMLNTSGNNGNANLDSAYCALVARVRNITNVVSPSKCRFKVAVIYSRLNTAPLSKQEGYDAQVKRKR
jgi:hypothetical protein